MSLQRKFITVIAVVVFIFSIVVSAYTLTKTSSEIRAQAQAEKKSLSEQVINMLKITDSIMMARVKSSMKLLIERGTASGAPVLASPVNVNGVNANNLIINDQAQANEFQLVDQLTAIMGGTATLFSRNNSDYVRISTNVKKQGRRAIGTKLAAQGKAIKEINSNHAYYGQVDILGMPFITGYEPMRSADGTIVGIWYVGYSADLKVLESLIDESRILTNGFVALRDSKGNLRAHSGIYSNTEIAEFISTSDDNWEISIAPFDTWGYDVVLGISNSEVSAKIQGAIISILVQVFLAGGILLLAILFLVRSMVGKPLNQYIEAIDDIAGGNSDLTRRFDERGRDEFSQMARGFNKLLERIQSTIREVSDNANHLLTVSNKLQQAANDSLSTVTKMRTQTEDVSIDVQKLSDNSQDVATNTKSADTAAADADTQTRHSVEVLNSTIEDIEKQASDVDSTVRVINELAIASEEISGVLDVIRNIAEQTNLLALNAAIEAARAGEQGRGFAVVADEVRSLASRTQSSTEEIRIMIDKLQDGSRKASEAMEGNKDTAFNTVSTTKTAGEALQKALDSVAKISALNRDNSSMTQAQHLVLQSVSNSVSQISAVGNENQQHANTIGECCKQLASLANQMSEQLGTYRI